MMELGKHLCQVKAYSGTYLGVMDVCLEESVEKFVQMLLAYSASCILDHEFHIFLDL